MKKISLKIPIFLIVILIISSSVFASREYKIQYDFSFCTTWWVDDNYTFCAEGKKILLSKETVNDKGAVLSSNYLLIQRISLYLGNKLVYESKGKDINLGMGIVKCTDAECNYINMLQHLDRGMDWDGETFSSYFYIYINAMENVGHVVEKIAGEKPIIHHYIISSED